MALHQLEQPKSPTFTPFGSRFPTYTLPLFVLDSESLAFSQSDPIESDFVDKTSEDPIINEEEAMKNFMAKAAELKLKKNVQLGKKHLIKPEQKKKQEEQIKLDDLSSSPDEFYQQDPVLDKKIVINKVHYKVNSTCHKCSSGIKTTDFVLTTERRMSTEKRCSPNDLYYPYFFCCINCIGQL